MKLIDREETIVVVTAADLDADASDRMAALRLQEEIDRRGAGHQYRRAVVVTDDAWFETMQFHGLPTLAIGGPGVNGVSGRFGAELPTVWSDDDRVIIQADLSSPNRRAALWGMDRAATAAAVDTFIARGWLDEFLDQCWRFRAGPLA